MPRRKDSNFKEGSKDQVVAMPQKGRNKNEHCSASPEQNGLSVDE